MCACVCVYVYVCACECSCISNDQVCVVMSVCLLLLPHSDTTPHDINICMPTLYPLNYPFNLS